MLKPIPKRFFGCFALVSLIGMPIAQAQSSEAQSSQAQSSQAQSSQAQSSQSLNRTDRGYLTDLAQDNMAEIQTGQMALQKSQNQEVRTFAQRMIDDHTNAQQQVQQLAQAKGVSLPTETDSKHKRDAKKLSALNGSEFDQAYLAQAGLKDHQANHELLQKMQSRAKDPDLKALAGKILPVVDQHLASVQQMHAAGHGATSSGSSGSGTTGSGMTGSGATGSGATGSGTTGSGTSGTPGSSGGTTPPNGASSGSSTGSSGSTGNDTSKPK
jgi:putative membrane protein